MQNLHKAEHDMVLKRESLNPHFPLDKELHGQQQDCEGEKENIKEKRNP